MDPLCHTLLGATLAGTRLGERSWGAAATLIIAANLPDIDVLAYVDGADTALFVRRGWTHGILAMVVLPPLLGLGVHAIGRWRGAAPDLGALVGLAYLGLVTHPSLDWLNTYGVRWLMPFDGSWFYGDALFIVDPWMWLALGGAAALRFSSSWPAIAGWASLAGLTTIAVLTLSPMPARVVWLAGLATIVATRWRAPSRELGRRACVVALAFAVLYPALALTGTWLVRRAVADARDVETAAVFAGPVAADPAARDIVITHGDHYVSGAWRWGDSFVPNASTLPRQADDPRVETAIAAPCVRGVVNWLRLPFFGIAEHADGGATVRLGDARYRRPGEGFAVTTVRLDADGEVLACSEPGSPDTPTTP